MENFGFDQISSGISSLVSIAIYIYINSNTSTKDSKSKGAYGMACLDTHC